MSPPDRDALQLLRQARSLTNPSPEGRDFSRCDGGTERSADWLRNHLIIRQALSHRCTVKLARWTLMGACIQDAWGDLD
jgi:hypothetical protein